MKRLSKWLKETQQVPNALLVIGDICIVVLVILMVGIVVGAFALPFVQPAI